MLPAQEKKTLERLLRLATEPDQAFTYDELCGFLFGIAMTPDLISPAEWVPVIFGGELPEFKDGKQFAKMFDCLTDVYNRMVTEFHNDTLAFPFDLDTLREHQLEAVYGWVSGFEEALVLREEIWDPEEHARLSEKKREELMHSLMTITGLVDPTEMIEMFEKMPDEEFQEIFPDVDERYADREVQIQVFLLATLPLSVETLMEHARSIERKRQGRGRMKTIPLPLRKTAKKEEEACPCPGGGSCTAPGPGPARKEAKIIKVDFPRHGPQKAAEDTQIYQLKINLQGAKPPIWRRIQVPGDTTLARLHKVIQLCMGWTDSHLHEFIIDRTRYTQPDAEDDSIDGSARDEAHFTLQALEKQLLQGFQYIYDFGDDWLHQVVVEKVFGPGEGKPYPHLLTGKRACPPEDIGGIPGFTYLLEVLKDPEDENYQEYREFLDEEYDPARFGKEEIALINVVLEEMYS